MYGSDYDQPTLSVYTKGLSSLCDVWPEVIYCLFIVVLEELLTIFTMIIVVCSMKRTCTVCVKKLAILSLRKTVYMVHCYKRTVHQRCANAHVLELT